MVADDYTVCGLFEALWKCLMNHWGNRQNRCLFVSIFVSDFTSWRQVMVILTNIFGNSYHEASTIIGSPEYMLENELVFVQFLIDKDFPFIGRAV
jgi:hypothetical protein